MHLVTCLAWRPKRNEGESSMLPVTCTYRNCKFQGDTKLPDFSCATYEY